VCLLVIDCVIKCFCCFATKHLCEINFIVVTFVFVCCICFVVAIIIVFFIVVNTFYLKIEYYV